MGDRDTERLIDAWLDGELPADEAAKVEAGLRCDPELRRQFGPMVALLRSPEPTDVPAASNITPDRTAVLAASPLIGRLPGSLIRINSNDEEDGRYMLHVAETSFGRAKGTYTFPDDLYMSTAHARIIVKGDQYLVEDLASTNGTFVRIRKRVLTRNGDTLLIGKQLLRVLAQQSTPVTD